MLEVLGLGSVCCRASWYIAETELEVEFEVEFEAEALVRVLCSLSLY